MKRPGSAAVPWGRRGGGPRHQPAIGPPGAPGLRFNAFIFRRAAPGPPTPAAYDPEAVAAGP